MGSLGVRPTHVRGWWDDEEPVLVDGLVVRCAELGAACQRRSVGQASADGLLLAHVVHPAPRPEVHGDPPHDQGGPAREPRRTTVDPDDRVEVLAAGRGVDGAIHLAHQVATGAAGTGVRRPVEPALHPTDGRERVGVGEQDAQGVRDRHRVLSRHLEDEVTTSPAVLELIDRECGQPLGQPARRLVCQPGGHQQSVAVPDGDGQPGWDRGQLRLRIGQRGLALGKPVDVVGEQDHHPDQGVTIDVGTQVEGHERGVRLHGRADPSLVRTTERLHDRSERRDLPGLRCPRGVLRAAERCDRNHWGRQRRHATEREATEERTPTHPPQRGTPRDVGGLRLAVHRSSDQLIGLAEGSISMPGS